jgi:hypothetical protein
MPLSQHRRYVRDGKTGKTPPVTMQERLVSSLAQVDALSKLLIEKGVITREEFMEKISQERATYQKLLIKMARRDESH